MTPCEAGTATPTCSAPTTASRWRAERSYTPPEAARRSTSRCWRGWAWPTACWCIRAPTATTSRCCSTPWRRSRPARRGRGAPRHAACAGPACASAACAARASATAAAPAPTSPAARRSTTCWPGARAGRRGPARRTLDRLQGAARHRRRLALPVPVVIDHMGGFDVAGGRRRAGLPRCFAARDRQGRVKLCAYRNLLSAPDFEPAGRSTRRCSRPTP